MGYVAYVDRFAGTLAGRAASGSATCASSASPTCTSCRCCARGPEPNDGGYAVVDYGAVEPRAGHDGRPRARWPPTCARAGMALCVDLVLNHTAREHPWAQARARRATRRMLAFYRTFADRDEPDAYEATLPEVFPDTAPGQLHLRSRSSAAGSGRRSTRTSGTSTTPTPRCSSRWRDVDARPRQPRASTSCGSTRCRSCGSAWGPTARTSPRSTTCCRRCRAVARIAAPAVAFKAEAIVAPRDLVAYLGAGGHEGHGVRPRLPQPPHGPAVERARHAAASRC